MKLFYYKDPVGNFGDDLNPLIWYSLYPEPFFKQERGETILGIGTLINDRAPLGETIFVCGSGVGNHPLPTIGENWKFIFVRGPLSAQALGLPGARAITDPANLIARIFKKPATQRRGIAYMPHQQSAKFADWEEVCRALQITYLDPADNISINLHKIASAELVIAEAMHAAIVADALRVPWIPVKAYSHILDFKWSDWCESLHLSYEPNFLPQLWDTEKFHTHAEVLKSKAKRALMKAGASGGGWTPPLPLNNRQEVFDTVLEAFREIVKSSPRYLSDDTTWQLKLEQVEETMDRFVRSI